MMQEIKGWVRNGRIETENPVSLPDGTELRIREADSGEEVGEWDNSPEGIRNWLEWYETLEPLIFTDEERERWAQERKARKEWEAVHSDERAQALKELWG